MKDYSLPIFDGPRTWVRQSRERGLSWEEIAYARKKDEQGLQLFLEVQVDVNFWPNLTIQDWAEIVQRQKDAEENTKKMEFKTGNAFIHDAGEENAVRIPQDPYSSWQLYKHKLLNDGFKKESVEEIERATLKILKRLNNDTTATGPVKGLVIGNVQSGKTANMAALMAMAADWGWNMFIVLSGTIENLRIQTQNRLFTDLNQQGTLFWRPLEHLSKRVDVSQKAQSLHFDPLSKERYFTVCLKNSARLSKLIQWAQDDPNKQQQMRIIVIDDEADQAGIQTGNIDAKERKKINKLICALVNGKNYKNEDIPYQYKAMNYIGYTATPYANILNEAKEESLYPRNFISTLAVSKEYFGPQQIFGYSSESPDTNFEGLDIVRTISQNELEEIKDIHDGNTDSLPACFIDSLCWFLCGVAAMRIWGYKKPISMLVHTSQKTMHHAFIADAITEWLCKTPRQEILRNVKSVWEKETSSFSVQKFRSQYPLYDRPDEMINNYPPFSEIVEQVSIILDNGMSNIKLGDNGDLTYHKGIHLCVDNCTNTGINSDGMHVRLAYPESSKMPVPAPAFIVVGGATLSRGLTIEGLISTVFLRSIGQADTLMQMGRWFGYRKNYEMLPRLWVTEKTKEQFIFLAALDQELRDEIQYMDITGRSPAEYGPKVKNSPKVSFIRITAKNKMQSATDSAMDYSGASNQTYLFDNDAKTLRHNIEHTENFLAKLGSPWKSQHPIREGAVIWRGVDFSLVRSFIDDFSFQERLSVFNDTKPLTQWVADVTTAGKLGKWNVIVAGTEENKNGTWSLPSGDTVNLIKRTKKINQNEADKILNIGVLRDPRDLLADIDIDSIQNDTLKKEIESFISSGISQGAMAYRDKSGLETTPQLIIYRVDKNSKVKKKNVSSEREPTREDLNAVEDLIGICLYIPGGRIGTSYASKVSIKMKNDLFNGDADMEGINED